MTTFNVETPRRALAIGAHPDDIEFGCGATLAKWANAGTDVQLLLLTDGSKGTWDAHAQLEELVLLREQEQRDAAIALGASEVHFLGFVDGELESGLTERARVCEVIRRVQPSVVLGHDPWKRYRLHPDHRHAGVLTVDGIVAARDPHFYPQDGLVPHRLERLLLFEADVVDHLEDIDGFVDTKIAALLCHRSQWHSTMGVTADDPDSRDAFAQRIRAEAFAAAGNAPIRAAEAFKLLNEL